MPEIKLKTQNKLISRFDSYTLVKSMYALANCAVLEFSDKNTEAMLAVKKLLVKGAKAEVLIDNDTQLKGYISAKTPYYKTADGNVAPCLRIKISSPSAAYVGCSIGHGRSYQSQGVADILSDLFPNIEIDAQSDRILPLFIVYGGEDFDTAVARLCAKSNLLIYSGSNGHLIVTEADNTAAPSGELRTGVNIISIEPVEYDEYGVTLIGQKPLADNTSLDEAINNTLSVPGSKNRIIIADDVSPGSLAAMQSKKKRINAVSPNWFDTKGVLLEVNTRLKVIDNWLDINEPMTTYTLILRLDKSGYQSAIYLETDNG